jgi:hypothetical protein
MSTEQTPALAFGNFINTYRTPATRAIYQKSLHYFMDCLKIERNEYEKLLTIEPKLVYESTNIIYSVIVSVKVEIQTKQSSVPQLKGFSGIFQV